MSLLDMYRSGLKREQDRLAGLYKDAAECSAKLARKQVDFSKASSPSRAQSLTREIENITRQRTSIERDIATCQKRLGEMTEKVSKEEISIARERDRKSQALMRDQERSFAEVQRAMSNTSIQVSNLRERMTTLESALIARVRDAVVADPVSREFDVFLSHTSKDEDEELAKELFNELKARDLLVWFDNAEMKLGESLTRQIDRGIAKSHIGVILVTPAFIAGRFWTEHEMGGLINTRKRVVPILDRVDRNQLGSYSPLLSDLVGLSTEHFGLDEIADKIAETIQYFRSQRSNSTQAEQ